MTFSPHIYTGSSGFDYPNAGWIPIKSLNFHIISQGFYPSTSANKLSFYSQYLHILKFHPKQPPQNGIKIHLIIFVSQ